MLFKDQIGFVRQHIKKNKLRVFMTVLAATMGCAFLIVLASVAFGVQDSIRKEILSDAAVTEIQVLNDPNQVFDLEKVKQIEHVTAVTQRSALDLNYTVQLDNRNNFVDSFFTNFEEEKNGKLKLSEGRFPTNDQEIVVGYHFAQQLMTEEERKQYHESMKEANSAEAAKDNKLGYQDPIIGKKITVLAQLIQLEEAFPEKSEFTVVGVLEKPAREWSIDTQLLFNNKVMDQFYNIYVSNMKKQGNDKPLELKDMLYKETKVYATDLEQVKGVSKELKGMGYQVFSVSDQLSELDVFFLVFKIGLIFVGTIAVLIASIGIFNTMTMAVTERTREIGVMKALGASPKLIQRLFLMESIWIGVVGTVFAVGISYAISYLANLVLPFILSAAFKEDGFREHAITFSYIPWQLVLIASLISIGVAVVSGWRPARKATKIDVIQALRQEI